MLSPKDDRSPKSAQQCSGLVNWRRRSATYAQAVLSLDEGRVFSFEE